jgi:DNA-binding CsgD family transcriptional regulator
VISSVSFRRLAAQVRCPTLIVAPVGNPWFSPDDGRRLAASFPAGELTVFPEPVISPLLVSDPSAAAEVIRDFVGAVSAPSDVRLASSSTPLTLREREVVALIAAGNTNVQIAEALTIAPATASRHVHNILEKLGMSRRSEAAAWWASNGNGRGE